MTTGSTSSVSRRGSARFAAPLVLIGALLPAACGGPPAPQRQLTPSQVALGGTPCFRPIPVLHASFHSLDCRLDNFGSGLCRIPPGEAARDGLRGIRQVDFAVERNDVRAVTVKFLEMVDVEFGALEGGLVHDFGSPAASPDSSRITWTTDSLAVTLRPGKKPHWTRFGSTYTPVLEYRKAR